VPVLRCERSKTQSPDHSLRFDSGPRALGVAVVFSRLHIYPFLHQLKRVNVQLSNLGSPGRPSTLHFDNIYTRTHTHTPPFSFSLTQVVVEKHDELVITDTLGVYTRTHTLSLSLFFSHTGGSGEAR